MAQPIRRFRWVIWVVCVAAAMALSGVSLLWSRVPPHPDAPLTPIEVVENYNFYERQLSDFDQHASALTPDGSWETVPAVYQNREWRELREEEFGEWSSVRFETNTDVTVAAMQRDFSPKGDPYDELVHVGWVMNEVLEPLLLAADPSGEARNPLQEGERQHQAGGACDALLSIPFQGAGAENQVEGPGGITVTLEVTQCEGYQASPYFGDYSILLQEKPGAGTLSFHITLEMP